MCRTWAYLVQLLNVTEFISSHVHLHDWIRSVSKLTGYGLDNRGSILRRGKNISPLHHIQTGSVIYPSSCLIGIGEFSFGDNVVGSWSLPSVV
jgi:hypothetical protein